MRLFSPPSLTRGNLFRGIFVFSLPLILTNLLQVLFNMADTAVVGRYGEPGALGSVGSTTIIVTLFTNVILGMGSAVNVIVARGIGAGQKRDVEQSVHTSAWIALFFGIAILVLGQIITRPLLAILDTKPDLIDGAELYLRIYFCGMPALALYNFGSGVLNAAGNTVTPLLYMSIAGALNIVLNLFFVIVLHMNVAGVAVASILSQYVSAILVLLFLMRQKGKDYALCIEKMHFSPEKARQILPLALISGLQNAIFQMANLFVQKGVNSFDTITVEGNTAATNADALVYDVMNAFYVACTGFISQNYGAQNKKRIRDSYFIGLFYSFTVGILMGVGIYACGENFLYLFTTDAAVVEAGMQRLAVMSLSYGFSAFMDCTIVASRGLEKSVVPTILVILGSCVFRIIWVNTVFAYFGTITSLYLLYIVSWTITAIAEIIYFVYLYKKLVSPLPDRAPEPIDD